jgi:hypothetical protein
MDANTPADVAALNELSTIRLDPTKRPYPKDFERMIEARVPGIVGRVTVMRTSDQPSYSVLVDGGADPRPTLGAEVQEVLYLHAPAVWGFDVLVAKKQPPYQPAKAG